MPELLFGMLVGVWAAASWGLDPAGSMVVGGIGAVLAYAGSCAIWPYRTCFVCRGQQHVGDNRGNYRYRWTSCWWCAGARDCRRLGARLMGRG